ncbi:PIG-L deacetylase family protein [Candidatus Latescibacterota bacterium]
MDRDQLSAFGGTLPGIITGFSSPENAFAAVDRPAEIVVERDVSENTHRGKVFAAVHAQLDNVPYYCGGTCAKLMKEGYTGYLIRTCNDEKRGVGTNAENIFNSERENMRIAKALGFAEVFDLYYRSHRMNGISPIEIRGRLIWLFRFLKVDTVLTFNPWGWGEENPDHWITGRAVEEACWMSGIRNDFSEHMEAGVLPHRVRERYYFVTRPGQPFNRVVDIGSTIEKKIDAIVECKLQGGGDRGSQLRKQLAKDGKRLPVLGNDDATADREFVRNFTLIPYKQLGKQYGLTYAERFYYLDDRKPERSELEEYIEKNAIKE